MLTALPLYRLHLADTTFKAGDVIPAMVFPIGDWHSAKYPDLPLTEELAEEIIANFEAGVLGREPVVDTSGKHDTSSPAGAWIKRVYIASYEEGDVTGEALWADWKLTGLGAQLLNDGQYQYDSAEIGFVVMNESGEKVENVLRSMTMTNTPVLSIMPSVQNAKDALRVAVTLSLSELTLAGNPENAPGSDGAPTDENPINGLLADFADWHGKLKAALKGTPGNSAVHTSIKACRDQLAQFCDGLKMAEAGSVNDQREALEEALRKQFVSGDSGLYVLDFGTGPKWVVWRIWDAGPGIGSDDRTFRAEYAGDDGAFVFTTPILVEQETTYVPLKTSEGTPGPTEGRSEPASRQPIPTVKGSEGHPLTAGASPQKGGESTMLTVIQKLNLAEDASEAIVLAEVTKLVERVETAETKLAESEKAANAAAVKVRLDEALRLGEIDAAEATTLAEKEPVARDAFLEGRKGVKHVDLTEHGQGARDGKTELPEGTTVAGADKAYAEALRTYMAEHKLTGMKGRDEAREALKREQPQIVTDYAAYLSEQHMGQLAQSSPSGDV
jgi:hypothetical protein